jgi:hypothetical protein
MRISDWLNTKGKVGVFTVIIGIIDWCARIEFVGKHLPGILSKLWLSPALIVIGFALVLVSIKQSARNIQEKIKPAKKASPDLWLGFDGIGRDATLCAQSRGMEALFDVRVKIPESGSCFVSQPITRVISDGSPHPCPPGTFNVIRDSVASVILKGFVHADAQSIPVRITYSTQAEKGLHFDDLEISLPFTISSFRRRKS